MKYLLTYTGLLLTLLLSSCDGVSLSRSDSDSTYEYDDLGNSVGGSLASFCISGEMLFTINDGRLVSYDISNTTRGISTQSDYILDNDNNVIYNLETIFPFENYLFLGATDGMYIIDISNPTSPVFVSCYKHIVSCDPVVVQGDYAYVTLRGGNNCGQSLNQLQVIDISDIYNPVKVETLEMVSPKGLGVDGDLLFVCDAGNLKVINNVDPLSLFEIKAFNDISAQDVIPYDSVLIVLGNGELRQYSYDNDELELLSAITQQSQIR